MFEVVNTAWIVLASIYHVAQVGAIHGATAPPLVQMFAVYVLILRDVAEPSVEHVLIKYSAWDPLPKLLQRLSSTKYLNLAQLPQYTMFEVLKVVFYLLLSAVLLLQTFAFQDEQQWGFVFLRLSLVVLLLSKQQCKQTLQKLVAFNHNAAGKGSAHFGPLYALQSTVHMIPSCCFCSPMVLSAVHSTVEVPVTGSDGGAPAAAVNGTAAAEGVDACLSSAVSTGASVQASQSKCKSCAILCGSPALAAVLQVACFEGALLAFLLCVPLLEALALPQSALLYSPAQSLMLVCGAYIQCAALVFLAGYLVHRRTIALELRAAERAHNELSAAQERTGDRKPAAFSAVGVLAGAVLSLLDCDARLSSMPGSSGPSEVDAFAADLSLTGTSSSSAPATGQQALSNGKGSNSNGRAGGSSVSATAAALRVNTSTSSTSAHGSAVTPTSSTVQFQPHPFMLSLCLLVVLAVALVQAALVLLGATNRKSSAGTALVALAGLVTAVVLRARVPPLCSQRRRSSSNSSASHHAHSSTTAISS